ncbi:MAG: glycosyltransferase family 4 protein, partial [Bacillota bacterium]
GVDLVNIAVFTDSYRPWTSGVVRSIDTFAEEISARGHYVYIFAPRYGSAQREEHGKVFRFYSLPSTNPGFNIAIPFSIRLKTTLRRLRIDLVHVHSPFLLGRLGLKCAREIGVPVVFTYHTMYDHYVHYVPLAQNLTKKITRHLACSFCNRCNLILVPSNVIGDYIRDLGVKVPIRKLPTGIKLDDFRHGDPGWLGERYGIGADEKVLLFVGRLGLEKNVEFLLKAFDKLLRVYRQPVRLVLVGGGPQTQQLKEMAAEKGISDRVIFTGPLSMDDVAHCYAGSRLFVFASMTETQGLVIGEAKAAGLPTVAIDAFGVSEMIEDGQDGFLTPPDEDVFVSRLLQLLTNEDLYGRFSRKALMNAESISSGAMAAQLINVYQELLTGRIQQKMVRGG